MGRVAELKRAKSRKTRSKGEGSDDSDEDYMVEEDEDYAVEEDEENLFSNEEDYDDDETYCSDSFDNDDKLEKITEDSGDEEEMSKAIRSKYSRSGVVRYKLGMGSSNDCRNAVRRDEEPVDDDRTEELKVSEEEDEIAQSTKSKPKRGCLDEKKLHTEALNTRRNHHREIDDEDYNVEAKEDDEDRNEAYQVSDKDEEVKEVTKPINMSCLDQKKLCTKGSNNRRNGEIDDEDYYIDEEEEEEEEDDEEEEFTLDESLSLEEEEEFDEEEELVAKKGKRTNRTGRGTLRKQSSVFSNKSKRTIRVANKNVGTKRKRSSCSRRKQGSEDDDGGNEYADEGFINKSARRGKTKKKPRHGTRKFTVQSDSDSVESTPSEVEFTISDEEREQVREASNVCRAFIAPLRSSCSKRIQQKASFPQRKPFVTDGKKKIQVATSEVVKQVCGICFTVEGNNAVRGFLNCCSHYFCFKCILEWSKVESRCPLCKQRFLTISKPPKANTGIDLRDVVLQIPERDQVYQPTEEEIRGYLDPYENLMCTECQEGGDDDLMLLCDLCDSPAHTYCVGLGLVVPEGNWYCECCRPVSLGASNNQGLGSLTGQRNLFHRLPSFDGVGGYRDGSLSSQFPHGYNSFPSPGYFSGGIQAPPSRSGTGVVTVSGRRQIHRHMQSMFSSHRTWHTTEAALPDFSVSYSQANLSHSMQMAYPPARPPDVGTSFYNSWVDESHDTPLSQNIQVLPVISNHYESQAVLGSSLVPVDSSLLRTFIPSNTSIHDSHLSSRPNVGHDYHLSSSTLGEERNSFLEEQVKPLVQHYLTSMCVSITSSLEAGTIEDIEKKSINTVLAAYGHHHNPNEVFRMPPQPLCTHIEYPLPGSFINSRCNSCYTNFIKEVVKTILNSRLPSFLHI